MPWTQKLLMVTCPYRPISGVSSPGRNEATPLLDLGMFLMMGVVLGFYNAYYYTARGRGITIPSKSQISGLNLLYEQKQLGAAVPQ